MSMASISEEKLGILSEITVIIFSRNRQSDLIRSIRYWSDLNIKCLILDNSPNEIKDIPARLFVSYLHCPNLNFSQRALIAGEFIKTKFSIICSDDERFIPTALEAMITELNNNLDIVSVGGHAIAVGTYGPHVYGTLAYSHMLHYGNLDYGVKDRMEKHFDINKSAWPIGAMYRIIRTESMKKLLNMFYQCQGISTPYIFEVTSEIVVTALGRAKYLDLIFWVRNWQTPAINQVDWDRRLQFTQWWEDEKYVDEKNKWVGIIRQEIFPNQDSTQIKIVFNSIFKLRKKTEKLHVSTSSLSIKNHYIKYYLRRFLAPKSLPKKFDKTLGDISKLGITSDIYEVDLAIASMLKN